MRLGIDFGTTNTVVALSDRGNYPMVSFFDADDDAHDSFPSVVAVDGDQLHFGFDAVQASKEKGAPLCRSFKRWLGLPGATPERNAPLPVELGLFDLVTEFLKALDRAIRQRSSVAKWCKPGEALEVAIAAPANSHSAQRFITLEAFRRAGFKVSLMLNEPSAAGVEYARRYERTVTGKRDSVLVYDLGGGTFDVSLVFIQGGRHDIHASTGIARLGGDDFDDLLVDLALEGEGLARERLSSATLTRLLSHCREVKEGINPNTRRLFVELGTCLSDAERTEHGMGADRVVIVPAADYEERCAPLLGRTLSEVERVLGEHESELAGLYVVGGGTYLPVVARTLRERFGRRVHRSPEPSAATAIGLAVALDPASEIGVRERLSRYFGVFREGQSGSKVEFDPILDAAFEVPSSDAGAVSIKRQYHPAHNIGHLRFVECTQIAEDGAPTGDITSFADLRFPYDRGLQAAGTDLEAVEVKRVPPNGQVVEEQYSIDSQGIVTLTLADLGTGYQQVHRFG